MKLSRASSPLDPFGQENQMKIRTLKTCPGPLHPMSVPHGELISIALSNANEVASLVKTDLVIDDSYQVLPTPIRLGKEPASIDITLHIGVNHTCQYKHDKNLKFAKILKH